MRGRSHAFSCGILVAAFVVASAIFGCLFAMPNLLSDAQRAALADIAEDEIRLYMAEHGRRWS